MTGAPSIPDPQDRVGFLIYRAGLHVARAYEERMRPAGFAPVEVGVLTLLASRGALHVRAVGRALGVSRQTAVNVTRDLERRGLVTRETPPEDRRALVVAIAPAGRDALARAEAIAQGYDAELAAAIGAELAADVAAGLRRVLAAAGD